MNEELGCGAVELDETCEVINTNLCYWLSHKVGCQHCYIHTLKHVEQKVEACERWEVTLSLLPGDIDQLHESEDCQFCKGEVEKKDGYAVFEMAHPEPEFKKGMIFGLGKKVRVPVGSLVSVQAGVCKRCRKAMRASDLITILTPVLALVLGIVLLMIPQIGQPMVKLFVLLPLIFLALLAAAGYFLGVNLALRHMKKSAKTVRMDISEIPQVARMLRDGWFFFQTNSGVPRLSFVKKKQYCRLVPEPGFKAVQVEKLEKKTGKAKAGAVPLEEAYRSLDLPVSATMEEVEAKYRKLREEFDPEAHPEHRALYEDLLEKAKGAYELISKKKQ